MYDRAARAKGVPCKIPLFTEASSSFCSARLMSHTYAYMGECRERYLSTTATQSRDLNFNLLSLQGQGLGRACYCFLEGKCRGSILGFYRIFLWINHFGHLVNRWVLESPVHMQPCARTSHSPHPHPSPHDMGTRVVPGGRFCHTIDRKEYLRSFSKTMEGTRPLLLPAKQSLLSRDPLCS